MKLEQACRFRMETGYRICAQSPGFTARHEEEMGKIFNDTMNPLFGKVGQSVFTCAKGEDGHIFLSRCTLRSSDGRTTMFTHAYLLTGEDYEQIMEQDSGASLLSLSAKDMLYTQPPSPQMDAISLPAPAGETPMLDQLRDKYQLDDARYAQLLQGAYRAITTSGSLCLHTTRPLSDTPAMVRELAFCIAEGLLPMLKVHLTYSSATDARMKVCVSSAAGGQSVGKPNLHFAVEPNLSVPPVKPDPMADAFFLALAKATPLERHTLLDQMQRWLSDLCQDQAGTSLGMIVAAYYLSSGRSLSIEEAARLVSNVLNGAKGSSANPQAVNQVLARLLHILHQGQACPNTLPQLVERSLLFPSPDYDEAVRLLIGLAPPEACAHLVDVLIHLKDQSLPNIKLMVSALLGRLPPEGEALSGALGDTLIAWVLTYDVTELNQWAVYLAERRQPEQQKALACRILENTEGHPLSSSGGELLLSLVRSLTRHSLSLDEAHSAMLDRRFPTFSPAGQDILLEHLLSVRLAQASAPVALLQMLQAKCTPLFDAAAKRLQNPTSGYARLWETYQTAVLLPNGLDFGQLDDVCRRYNSTATFMGSGGPFEPRVVQLWLDCLKQELEPYIDPLSRKDVLLHSHQMVKNLSLSRTLQKEIDNQSVSLFWSGLPYEKIFTVPNTLPSAFMSSDDPETKKKIHVMRCVSDVVKDPRNIKEMQNLIFYSGGRYSSAQKEAFRKGLYDLTVLLVKESHFFSWDLLLMRCYVRDGDETEPSYHCAMVAEDVAKMESRGLIPADLHAPLSDSAMLQQDPELRKEMKKVIGYKAPRLLQELGEELKSDSRLPWQKGKAKESSSPSHEGGGKSAVSGFFQNLFGGRKGQSTPPTGPGDSGPIHYQNYVDGSTERKKGGKRVK